MNRLIFAIPQPLEFVDASVAVGDATNLLNNEPGLVFRSMSLSGVYTIFQTSAPFDVVALVGTSLIGTDTVRIRASNVEANLTSSPAIDITVSKASGAIRKDRGSLYFHQFNEPISYTYIRIDYASTNPIGYVEASRLIVGEAVEGLGIDTGAEINYDNTSASYLKPYRTTPTWKITVSGITQDDYWTIWDDVLRDLGTFRAFLLIPDNLGDHVQKQHIFCRFVGAGKTVISSSDHYSFDLVLGTIL